MNIAGANLTSLSGTTVAVTVSPLVRLRLWVALFFIWCAVRIMGADELHISTCEPKDDPHG